MCKYFHETTKKCVFVKEEILLEFRKADTINMELEAILWQLHQEKEPKKQHQGQGTITQKNCTASPKEKQKQYLIPRHVQLLKL